jgi:hypothetical protein
MQNQARRSFGAEFPYAPTVTINDPTDGPQARNRWQIMREFVNRGVNVRRVRNDWNAPKYVRFFLTDEKVVCFRDCIKRTVGALSPIYKIEPYTQTDMYYATADKQRGFLHPGIRIRIFWSKDAEDLASNGSNLSQTFEFPTQDGGYYTWRRIEVDNQRIDNWPSEKAIVVCGSNLLMADCYPVRNNK